MTTPEIFAPHQPSAMDTVAYTKRVVDSIVRNNPLRDATVGGGLIKWLGNYANGGGTGPDKINFLWVGEFLPADVNLPGSPPQRGFSLVRDDSRGGVSAIALFDGNPGGGGGLKQALTITSGDTFRLLEESRDGGQKFPAYPVAVGYIGSDASRWYGTDQGTFSTIAEGRVYVVGTHLAYRVFDAVDAGATGGEFRLRVSSGGTDITSALHTLGAGATSAVVDSSLDITAFRGQVVTARWEGRRVGGANSVRSSVLVMANHSL